MKTTDRTWVEISRRALRQNVQSLQQLVGTDVRLLPVIKAHAYGHDPHRVIQALRGIPVYGFGVAYGQEALQLRRQGFRGRLVVLSYWDQHELRALDRQQVEVVVWDKVSWGRIRKLAPNIRIHLKLDSGTSRIGFLPREAAWLKKHIVHDQLRITGVFSHFANSEEASSKRTLQQLNHFTTLIGSIGLLRGIGRHIACTAAAMRYPEARFGLIRPGIGVYGLWPSLATKRQIQSKYPGFTFKPALTWKTRISQVKVIPAGSSVGYGSTVTVKQATRIGILPVGYSDGYARALSQRGIVQIGKKVCRVIGRVSMNVMAIDLTHVPSAKDGVVVTLLGDLVTAEQLAEASGTINYEVLTNIRSSIPRYLVS